MTPQKLIKLYEGDHGCRQDRESRCYQRNVSVYGYVRPRPNGEAQFEVWIAAKSKLKKDPGKLRAKCVAKMRTDKPRNWTARDIVWYESRSPLCASHWCYDYSEIRATRNYNGECGAEQGKWFARSGSRRMPLPAVMLNGWEETKYKYWAYDPDCNLTVQEYVSLYNITPKVELLSKAGLFRLLDAHLCHFLNGNKRFGKFLAQHLDEAKEWTPFVAMSRYAKVDKEAAAEVRLARRRKHEEMLADMTPAQRREWLARRRAEKKRREEQRKREEELNARLLSLYNQIYTACRVYGAYEVVCPKTRAEMMAEGKAMHNCIGHNYAPRQGVQDICLFLRKDGKPYVDFRIDAKTYKVQECRLVCNKNAGRAEWKIARNTAKLVQAVRERKDGAKRKTA